MSTHRDDQAPGTVPEYDTLAGRRRKAQLGVLQRAAGVARLVLRG